MVDRVSRRRGAELEDAILAAAWKVLLAHGYHSFTYEAVAAEAGTSRPVLYRRWPQREELLLAAITRTWQSQPISLPDTGNLRDDAVELLRRLNARRPMMVALMSAQIVDYFRDSGSSFSELRKALYSPGEPTAFEKIVIRAVERGELSDAARPGRVLNLPFDLFRHDAFMTMSEASDDAIIEIVDDIWLPLLRSSVEGR